MSCRAPAASLLLATLALGCGRPDPGTDADANARPRPPVVTAPAPARVPTTAAASPTPTVADDGVRCPGLLPPAPPPGARVLVSGVGKGTNLALAEGQITTVTPREATTDALEVDAVTYDADTVTDNVREYRIEVAPTAREPYTLACGYGARTAEGPLPAWLLLPLPAGRRWRCSIRWQWDPPRPEVSTAPTTAGCL